MARLMRWGETRRQETGSPSSNTENGSLERCNALENGVGNGDGGQPSTSQVEDSGYTFASKIYSELQSVYQRKRPPLFLRKCSEQYRVDKRVRGALGLPKDGVRATEKNKEMLSLKVSLNFHTEAEDEKNLTVFCVVGQTTDKLSIRPLRVALVQAEFGQSTQIELSFPAASSPKSKAEEEEEEKNKDKDPVAMAASEREKKDSAEVQAAGVSAKSDYVLMLIVWDDHKDVRFLSREDDLCNNKNVRYMTERSSRGKIFTVIPSNSEILWYVMPLPGKVSKDWEGESLQIKIPNANIRFERARLNLDQEAIEPIDEEKDDRAEKRKRRQTYWNRICLWQTKITEPVPYTATISQSVMSLAVKTNGDELTLPELWFEYQQYRDGKRKKPVTLRLNQTSSNSSCAFCYFKVGSGVCLMEHLKSSHGLFPFKAEWTTKHNYCIKVYSPKKGDLAGQQHMHNTYNKVFAHVPSRSERLERVRNFENSVFDEYVNRLSETKDSSMGWQENGHVQEIVEANTNGRATDRPGRNKSKLHKRGGGPEPVGKKMRATGITNFYHSRTGIRMTEKEIHGDLDSDDDFEQNYLVQESNINRCHWLTAQQKKFMNEWNLFINRQPQPIADKSMNSLCTMFAEEIVKQNETGLKDYFVVHVMQLWHHGTLTRKESRTLIDAQH